MSGPGDRRQLGKILVRHKLVSPEGLEELLRAQRALPGQRLASIALREGRVDGVDLLRALSEQHAVPGIDLSQVVIPTANLALVPLDVAKHYGIVPFSVTDDAILLAMADPNDARLIEEIEFVTGRAVQAYVALHEPLERVLDEAYRLYERGEPHYVGPNTPADYLDSLGLRPPPPRSVKPSVRAEPRERAAPSPPPTRNPPALAGAPATGKLPPRERAVTLDAAFESRVGPLPREDDAVGRRSSASLPKVLVVDDEDDIRRMLRRVLVERGYHVLEAKNGNEALQLVRDHQPDLLLLDAMLPEVHGFDVARRIKTSQKYGHIPIIMLSAIYRGWRFAEDLRESFGVNVFLEKPFKISDVLAAVERTLAARPEPDEADEQLSDLASNALTSGIDAYKSGDIDGAIAHLLQGVAIDPVSFRLHYHLGLLYGRRDNLFEAIQEMETAVDLAPRNFAALKNLAVLYQRAGFKHRAIEIWERALSNAPDDETKRGIKDHLMSLL